MAYKVLFNGIPTNIPAYMSEIFDVASPTINPITIFASTLTPVAALQANPGSICFTTGAAPSADDGVWIKGSGVDTSGWVQFSALGIFENPTFIPDPPAAHNANTTALAIYNALEPIVQFAPTATRNIDVRTITTSMAFTVMKTNTAAFGINIDVTSGGNQGWTTPAGLNTDYVLFNSAAAAAGSWLVRLDLPNKTVLATPVA
jgi:hypothetical protein